MKKLLVAVLLLTGLSQVHAAWLGTGTAGGSGGGGGANLPATVAYTTSTKAFTVPQTVLGASFTVTGAGGIGSTYGVNAGSFTGTGTGNGIYQQVINGDTYTMAGSSALPTSVGATAIYTSTNGTLGAGGALLTFSGTPGSVVYSADGTTLNGTSFMTVGTSSITVSTNVVIAVGGASLNSPAIFNLYRGSGQNATIMSVGSNNNSDQFLISDGNPINMRQSGMEGGSLQVGGEGGNTGNRYTLAERSNTTSPNQGMNFWTTVGHGIDIKTASGALGGTSGPITLSPGNSTEVTVSSFGVTVSTTVTVLASMTVTGANGLGLTAGPLAMTAQAAPIFANGNLWNDSTQNSLRYTVSGATQIVSGTMWTMTVSSSINTTATEGEIISTNSTTGVGTLNLPANFFTAGKSIYLVLSGTYTTTGTPTLDIKVKLSTTTILDTGVVTQVAVTGTDVFTLSALITCRTTGTTGTVMATGQTVQNTNTIGSTGMDLNSTLTTTNTTIAEPIKVTVTWGTSSASNNLTFTNGFVEVKN